MNKKKNNIDNDGVNEVIYLSKKILKLLFIVLLFGIVLCSVVIFRELGIFTFISSLFGVLSPLFIGFVVAWLFSPIVNKMTKKGMSRILASVIVYVIFLIVSVIFVRIFIPVIFEEMNSLLSSLPGIINKITDFVNNFFDNIKIEGLNLVTIKTNIVEALNQYGTGLSVTLPKTLIGGISNFASGMGNILFGLIIGLYMLFDFDNISNQMIKILPKRLQLEALTLLTDIGTEVRKCVNGTLLVACMVFVCDTIGFAIVGLNASLLFGLFCGITDLIPYIGPYIGTAAAAVVGFTQNPLVGIGVLIIAIIVQMVESYILQPVVMSKATNLHPVAIILGLLVFGHFFGIIGMIFATPCLSIVKVIWHFINTKFKILTENTELEEA
ncbi:MAG: AI-2E family transporter [Clostridia bacterium]